MVPLFSSQNQRIKQIVKLRNRRQREASQLAVVEGTREVQLALANGHVPVEAFICPALLPSTDASLVSRLEGYGRSHPTQLFEVTPEVYAKIAYRSNAEGVLITIPQWDTSLAKLPTPSPCTYVVVEDVEKPGNLGGILRTADAAGVSGVIACYSPAASATDIFNPNVIRASLGALFSVPIAVADSATALRWLHQNEITVYAATPAAETVYTAVDMRRSIALAAGSEALGLSQPWLDQADQQILIPMLGQVDSLNLSVSTALLVYESLRQRRSRNGKSS